MPNLWEGSPPDREMFDNIMKDMRKVNAQMKRTDIPDVIYATFVERVRSYLHVVMCMSPVGDQLRVNCRKFPALVDCTTLDWFSPWYYLYICFKFSIIQMYFIFI